MTGERAPQIKPADKTIDVFRGTIYVTLACVALAEGLSSTTHPEVELHYVHESRTPSPPPN
jgi:hypothetical protein